MLKFNDRCKVCLACKEHTQLVNDIYNSSFYMKSSKVGLRQVHALWRDENGKELFMYGSLRKHVKNHQFINQADFTKRYLNNIANAAERDLIKRTIDSKTVWDSVIERGMEGIEDGSQQVKVGHMLKAAKDKSDWEMKQKDQQLAMMEMVFHFSSGENDQSVAYDRRFVEGKAVQDYDPADSIAGSAGEGEDGPSSVHYPPSWDAVTSGPSEIPARDDQTPNQD